MKKVSIDMAERNGLDLRDWLVSAERLSERAICLGARNVNTPGSSISAALSSVTRCDQRRLDFFVFDFVRWVLRFRAMIARLQRNNAPKGSAVPAACMTRASRPESRA